MNPGNSLPLHHFFCVKFEIVGRPPLDHKCSLIRTNPWKSARCKWRVVVALFLPAIDVLASSFRLVWESPLLFFEHPRNIKESPLILRMTTSMEFQRATEVEWSTLLSMWGFGNVSGVFCYFKLFLYEILVGKNHIGTRAATDPPDNTLGWHYRCHYIQFYATREHRIIIIDRTS